MSSTHPHPRTRATPAAYFRAPPVTLPTFRDLLEDAPSDAWVALVPRDPVTSSIPLNRSLFEVQLVVPSAERIERLKKARGGIREWVAIDRAIQALDALLRDAGRASDLEIFVIPPSRR